MPYIPEKRKDQLEEGDIPENAGELNYLVTKLIIEYLDGEESYKIYNEVVGVLECAKLEIYRRLVVKYEDQRMCQNGDVFT